MPTFDVLESTQIEASAEAVWPRIREFRSWPDWSPWLIAEPDCEITYRDDGAGYGWDGTIVGRGEIEITAEEPKRSLDLRLTFLKPWKSTSDVRFELQERAGTTEVSWHMSGSLPWFLFWMKKMMTAWIGMDYQRGLAMLKELVETGRTPSHLEFPGEAPFEGTAFVGVRTACRIADMPEHMKADMDRLHAWVERGEATPTGAPFSIYHRWQIGKGTVEYTVAAPLAARPAAAPDGMVVGEVPPLTTYRVKHTGPYHHLGNAWSAGLMHARAKVFKQDKSVDPFEIYENDPHEVEPAELVTVLHFPAK